MGYRNGVSLQIGLVTAQVDINSAVEKEESLSTVCVGTEGHEHPATKIRQTKSCPECSNNDYPSFKKAREVRKGSYVLIDQETVAEAKDEALGDAKTEVQLSVHPVADVRELSVQGGGVYYLTPSTPGAAKVLDTLRDAMFRHPELAFLGKWAPSTRANLYEFKLFGDTLVMEERADPTAIKILAQPLGEVADVYKGQMDMLLEAETTPFDPEAYSDQYRKMLDERLANGTEVALTTDARKGTQSAAVVDLSEMLAASLAAKGVKAPAKKAAVRKPRAQKVA